MSTTPEQERSAPTQPAVRPQEAAAEKKHRTPTTAAKEVAPEAPVPAEEAPPAPAPAPVYSASELMGKTEAEVTDLMGAPARVEQRNASTVWVYQGSDCGLDVFFFKDLASANERVLTVTPASESANSAAVAAEATAAGAPAADNATDPSQAAEGAVVDACYGKLRRS